MIRVKKNDRVRIKCQGLVAEGPVRSAYDTWIDGPSEQDYSTNRVIGYEPEGIEMSDENSPALLAGVPTGEMGLYRYWKRGDGGIVYLLQPDGEWVQVFPHTMDGRTRYDE